jgi:hypothetical protein
MSVDSRFIELINADIDGEIDGNDKRELDAYLAANEEARTLHEDLSGVAKSLANLPELEPPPHLRHQLSALAPSRSEPQPAAKPAPGFFSRLIENPVLGYVGTFAAGVALTMALMQSGEISSGAFDDVTGLVGTVADSEFAVANHGKLNVDADEVVGTVTLRSTGPILIVDFELSASEPVEIVARFADESMWFNGFAQLQSTGTSIAAESGQVTVTMDGNRRYAVYLNNPGSRPATIDMRISAGGNVIYESELRYSTTRR